MVTLRYTLLVVLVVVHDAVEARGWHPQPSQHSRPVRREAGRAHHMYQNKTATVEDISSSLPLTVASIQTSLPVTDEDGYPEVPGPDDPPYDDIPMNKGQAPEPVNVDDPDGGSQDRGHWTYDSAVYGDLPTSDWGDYGITSTARSSSLGLTSSEPSSTSASAITFIATTTLPSITSPSASTTTTFVTPTQTQLQDSSVGAKPFSYLETSSGFDPLPTGPVNLTSLWESQGPYQTGAWLNMVTINATWVLQPNTLLPSCATHSATIDHIIYVTTFTSTVTYMGPRARYTPMPASLPPDSLITPPPALPTASTALLSEVPLGTTMISGTYNLCLLPEKVYTAFILHCWGIGTRPAATTCYSQTYRDNVLKKPTPSSYSLVITTIIVTAKGPTTVLPPQTTPDYGAPSGTDMPYVTHTPVAAPPTPILTPFYPVQTDAGSEFDASNAGSGFGSPNPKSESHSQQAQPTSLPVPVAIEFEPTAVVIGGHTFTDPVPSGATSFAQTVTVGLSVYTILPDRVAGMGTTIDRPAYRQDIGGNDNGVFAESPTAGLLGSLYVSVRGFDVFVDGTRFALPAQPSTAVVHGGQTVYLGPDGISAQGQTLHIVPMIVSAGSEGQSGGLQHPLTEVVVAGGRLVAVDASHIVISGSTIEYGNEQSTALLAAGDAVTILPLIGIVYHGTTIKAPPPGATHYELVGGVTFSEVGSSVVVLDGHFYTLGSSVEGPTTIITAIDGETVVVGPSEVVVGSSLTFPYPFVPAVTITPHGVAERVSTTSSPTQSPQLGSNGGDRVASTSKNAASSKAVDLILLAGVVMVSLVFSVS